MAELPENILQMLNYPGLLGCPANTISSKLNLFSLCVSQWEIHHLEELWSHFVWTLNHSKADLKWSERLTYEKYCSNS